jgi:hypothetical protein
MGPINVKDYGIHSSSFSRGRGSPGAKGSPSARGSPGAKGSLMKGSPGAKGTPGIASAEPNSRRQSCS